MHGHRCCTLLLLFHCKLCTGRVFAIDQRSATKKSRIIEVPGTEAIFLSTSLTSGVKSGSPASFGLLLFTSNSSLIQKLCNREKLPNVFKPHLQWFLEQSPFAHENPKSHFNTTRQQTYVIIVGIISWFILLWARKWC
jgi:hypothetical protein